MSKDNIIYIDFDDVEPIDIDNENESYALNILQRENLRNQIKDYFFDKDFDTASACEEIFNVLTNNIECDYFKLEKAFASMNEFKNQNPNFTSTKIFAFDVTKGSVGKMTAKFVSSSLNEPIVLLYNNEDNGPFLKITSRYVNPSENKLLEGKFSKNVVIECSDNAKSLVDRKIHGAKNGFSYLIISDYLINDRVVGKKKFSAQSSNYLANNFISEESLQKNHYEFYETFSDIMQSCGSSLPSVLTDRSKEILFDCFYNTINDITSGKNEFSFPELLKILEKIYNEDENESGAKREFVDPVTFGEIAERYGDIPSNNGFDCTLINKDGEPRIAHISKNSKYVAIDIFNQKRERITNYIIHASEGNAALFRNSNQNDIKSFTFSISKDCMRYQSLGMNTKEDLREIPTEMIVNFDANGKIHFDCSFVFSAAASSFGFQNGFNNVSSSEPVNE